MLARVVVGRDLGLCITAGSVTVVAAALTAVYLSVAAAVLVGVVVVLVALRHARIVAPLLVIAAVPLARPGILGEKVSVVATSMVALGALLALTQDQERPAVLQRYARPLWSVCLWLLAVYLWLLLATGVGAELEPRAVLQSLVLTVGTVWAAAVVLAEPTRALLAAKMFTLLVMVACASYAVTFGLWQIGDIGSGQLGVVPVGDLASPQPVYFPFTTTSSTQTVPVFGELPRFVGVTREPGWMAMLIAFTFFLLPRIGWSRWWLKLPLLVGLLGTVSTAGFGIFVIVWAYEVFLRPRPHISRFPAYVRQLSGIAVLTGATYLAVYAPVLGLAEKRTLNEVSLQDRQLATEAGLVALRESPLFGGDATTQAAINLVASIAAFGLPFAILVMTSLLLPRRSHTAVAMTTAPVAVLMLTLLTSQPAADSTLVWVLALLIYSVSNVEDASSYRQGGRYPTTQWSSTALHGQSGSGHPHI